MSSGARIQRLRLRHGHTLQDAHKLTGVSRATLCRMENGVRPPRFDEYLQRIADGYGVPLESLLRDPVGDFAALVEHLDPMHRLSLLRAHPPHRAYMVLRFLADRCDVGLPPEMVAELGLTVPDLVRRFSAWREEEPEPAVLNRVVETLDKHLGLPVEWVRKGSLADESVFAERCRHYHLAIR